MQSDNFLPRSKKFPRKYSDQKITCVWNVVQCIVILLWRGMYKIEDEIDNFFQFRLCLSIWVVNVIICCILSNFHRDGEKYQMSLFLLKFGLVTPMLIHILTILFGAPFLKYWDRTISFSMLCSALILPSVATTGKLGENFSNFSGGLDWVGVNELCTCLGAWMGAFVIPLDWDRPWQVWPEPCCLGAVLGCGLSSLLKLIRTTIGAAGYQMYWPTQFFVHERHV